MRVLTLNLANYDDHPQWGQRARMIAEDLIQWQPDLVALQEVRFNPDQESTRISYQNMGEEVLRVLRESDGGEGWAGTSIVSQPAMYYPTVDGEENPWRYPQPASTGEETKTWEGLSSLARSRVFATGCVFLSKGGDCTDGNRRITQFLASEESDGVFHLFNTHFGLSEACRMANVEETLDYMNRYSGARLLAGDLNATPDDPALEPLRAAGWVDLWAELRGDTPGYTYPSDSPSKRIDYLWADPELTARATAIDLVATEPDADGVYASDHFGLCVTLEGGG